MKCSCKDWAENIDKLNAPLLLQVARTGSGGYDGKTFIYCPWCSLELTDADMPHPESDRTGWRSSFGPREPLPCPHDDCLYRDGLSRGRPCVWFRINEDDAKALIEACEHGHPHRATLIIKQQPWYPGLAKGIQ